MGRRLLLFCSIIFIINSCKENQSEVTALETLYPLEDTRDVGENISDYIADVDIVRIDDDERLFFGDVAKTVLDNAGNIYILDYRGNVVSLMPDGMFFRQIARQGRASNEYANVSDIAYNGKELIVLSTSDIKCFDIGAPEKYRKIELSVKVPCDAIAPCGNMGFYVYSAFPAKFRDSRKEKDNLLYLVDNAGNIVSEYIKREDCTFSTGNITQSYGNSYYLRPQNNSHIFYRLDDNAVTNRYKIDFGSKAVPARYYYDSAGENIGAYMASGYFKVPMNFHDTWTHLFFHAAGPEAEDHCFVYDKRSGKGIHWVNSRSDPASVFLASDRDCFYGIIPAGNYDTPGGKGYGPYTSFIFSEIAGKYGKNWSDGSYIVKIYFKAMI